MVKKDLVYFFKRTARVIIDAFLFALSLIVAYKLRLEHNLPYNIQNWYWNIQLPFVLGFVVLIRVLSLAAFNIYSKLWRYTEINEIFELTKPIIFSSLLLSLPRVMGYPAQNYIFAIPVGVVIIDSTLSLTLLSFARLTRKLQIERRAIKKRYQNNKTYTSKKRVLLIGAGQAAQELARKITQHPELDIEIICALDDSLRKQNTTLPNNIKVVGQINALLTVVKQYNVEQIIIAIPSLPAEKLRTIIELCQKTNLETKIIPGVDQLAGGQISIEQIRKISLEDLLGREPVDLSLPEVANFINNKTILITGAGGSIGSEITRQLIRNFSPAKIYVLGRGENSIFQLTEELKYSTKTKLVPVICDIRNYNMLYKNFIKIAPDVVFHAAAHKHVPLMEDHAQEAFENNVIGTLNVARIAGLLNTDTFVNISTDKAVNPINVLGATKRLSELIVNSCTHKFKKTKYLSVRFGNVIGSRGSVIPTWQAQLKNNLPITITHKDAYRFFMTIQESAQLVIKAAAVGNRSEIMVLDMGNEVNIFNLAKEFIRLSGFDINQVKVTFCGLRPGEKLKEELIGYYEGTKTTNHKKILSINSLQAPNNKIKTTIKELTAELLKVDEQTFKNKLLLETKKINELAQKIPVEV